LWVGWIRTKRQKDRFRAARKVAGTGAGFVGLVGVIVKVNNEVVVFSEFLSSPQILPKVAGCGLGARAICHVASNQERLNKSPIQVSSIFHYFPSTVMGGSVYLLDHRT
jgi:hypothetical protein